MNTKLDRFVWHALSGRQRPVSLGNERARRFAPEYSPFAATRDDSTESLAALHAILPDATRAVLVTPGELAIPDTLSVLRRADIGQWVLPAGALASDVPPLPPATRTLTATDVPAMMALVAVTNPGPFAERTVELGRYLGVFEGETLIAMAGERMLLDGFVEISAVCTHPDHRGRRLSTALMAELARGVFARGETPFLHAFTDNLPALAVYRKLGFALRATFRLTVVCRAE